MFRSAPVQTVTARLEVVLSAGSVSTAQILQLSGIGDKAALDPLGIPTIVNNPSVGRNMSDHALVPNVFSVNGTETFDELFRTPETVNNNIAEWQATKKGPLAGGVANHLGFLRLPSSASIFKTTPDPAAGPKSSHWEFIISVRRLAFWFLS